LGRLYAFTEIRCVFCLTHVRIKKVGESLGEKRLDMFKVEWIREVWYRVEAIGWAIVAKKEGE